MGDGEGRGGVRGIREGERWDKDRGVEGRGSGRGRGGTRTGE